MTPARLQSLLFLSLAANIFLVAFVLGRLSAPSFMPPSGFPSGPMMMADHHGPHDGMPPPPRFLHMDALFTPEEMRANFDDMRNNFEQMQKLREDFAHTLQKGAPTKADVLQHFATIDKVMDAGKKKLQEKAADKLTHLSPDARRDFAERLMSDGPPLPPR